MRRDDFWLGSQKTCTTVLLLSPLLAMLSACNKKEESKLYHTEHSITTSIQNAYRIRDSININASFKYLDSLKKSGFDDAICLYYIYSYKHNIYLNDLQNADSAMVYADSMVAAIENNPDYKWDRYKVINVYNAKADAYYYKGMYKDAYEWYNRYKDKISIADSCLSGSYNYRIGMALYKEERYAEAAECFKMSFREQRSCKQTILQLVRMQEILSNTGLCYRNMKMPDSAIYYYLRAMNFINRLQKKYPEEERKWLDALSVVYGNLGKVYIDVKNYAQAIANLNKSIEIDERYNINQTDLLNNKVALSRLYIELNKPDMAAATLKQVESTLDTNKFADVVYQLYDTKWRYYRAKDDIPNAFYYLQKYANLKDSLIDDRGKAIIGNLSEDIKAAEQLREKEKYESQKKIDRMVMILLIMACIAAALTILALVRIVFKRKKVIDMQYETLDEIAWLQSHEMRKPVATMKGLIFLYNKNQPEHHDNKFIIQSLEELLEDVEGKIREISERVSQKYD